MRTRTFLALLCGAAAAGPLPPTPAAAQRDCAPAAGCPRGPQPPSTDEPAPSPAARAPAAEPAAASTYAAPVIDTSPQSLDYGLVNAAASHAGYTTPAYVSRDMPRSVTLFYSSASTASRGFVQVDATDNSTQAPTQMSIRVKAPDGSWWTPETFYQGAVGTSRLGVSWDMSAATTGTYDGTVVVRSYFADGSVTESSSPVRVPVVTRDMAAWSGLAPGWAIAGQQRVRTAATLALWLTNGDGTIERFDQDAGGLYHGLASDPTTLRYDGAGSIIRAYPDGGNVYFSATSGEMTKQVDRFGNTTTWNHDAAWRLTSIVDPAGKAITFGYLSGGTGQLSTITDPGGRITRLYYNAATDLTSIVDPAGGIAFQADYQDAFHRMTNTWDRAGQMTTYAYGGNSLLCCVWAPTITVGGQSVRPYTVAFSPVDAALPAAGKGTQSVPADHKTGASVEGYVTDPNGNTTYAAVTAAGSPWRIRDPLGRTTSIAWNAAGQPLRTLAPNGHAVSYTWSGLDLVKVWDEATGDSTRYEYGPYHQPTRVVHGATEVLSFYNSTTGVMDSTRVAGKPATQYTYDAAGRVTRVVDPLGHWQIFAYVDSAGTNSWQNVSRTSSASSATSYVYDWYGRRTREKSSAGTTEVDFDQLNRVERIFDPAGLQTRYAYSTAGDTLIDPAGQRFVTHQNALGWTDYEVDPNGLTKAYGYDAAGRLLSYRNRRGQTITMAYDAGDRPTAQTADGSTTTWSYDPGEAWAQVQNYISTDRVELDAMGRPTRTQVQRPIAGLTVTMDNTYDVLGRRTQLSATGPWSGAKVLGYRYDALGRLDQLTDLGGGQTALTYNTDGQLQDITLPNALKTTLSYNSQHGTSRIGYSNPTLAAALTRGYWYTGSGQIRDRLFGDSLTFRRYDYDGSGRVSFYGPYLDNGYSTCHTDPAAEGGCAVNQAAPLTYGTTFTYDAVGNPTDNGGASVTGNRLTVYKGYTMEYDADGNLTRKYKAGFDERYWWNSLGQLTQVTLNGTTTSYAYDGLGRWARRLTQQAASPPSTTTLPPSGDPHQPIGGFEEPIDPPADPQPNTVADVEYVWDGSNLLFERDQATGALTEYAYYPGVDQPHSVKRGTVMSYYVSDFSGSVAGLVNGAQQLVNEYRYTPFGQPERTREAIANALKFHSQPFEPSTGLYYSRARWYDPELGRFVSEDPIGLEGGMNVFAFGGSDPVNNLDPSGLDPCDVTKECACPQVPGAGTVCQSLNPHTTVGMTLSTYALWLRLQYDDRFPEYRDVMPASGGGGGKTRPNIIIRAANSWAGPDPDCQAAFRKALGSWLNDAITLTGGIQSVRVLQEANAMRGSLALKEIAREAAKRGLVGYVGMTGASVGVSLLTADDEPWWYAAPIVGSIARTKKEADACIR